MRILTRSVECGEYVFSLATDRDIAVKTFEAFPEFVEAAISTPSDSEKSAFLNAVREKKLASLLNMTDKIGEVAAFVLPLMLKKAGGDERLAPEIIEYARVNDVDLMLNSAILEFLMQGFTLSERERAPKVRFAMK